MSTEQNNYKHDIFIAYKREDRAAADQILKVFMAHGWRVFIDTSINAGAHFSVELEEALDASRSVVVLWSEKSKASYYVIDEATEGRDRGVLFPALVERTRPPYGFRQIQTVDLCEWDGKASYPQFKILLESLEEKLGKPEKSSGSIQQPETDTTPQGIKTNTTDTPAGVPEPALAPSDIYRDTLKDGTEGPEMVVIPAGRFLMGSPEGEGHDDERPQHEVTIAQPFSMGRYAVSFTEFDAFCESTNRKRAEDDFGRDMQPVINVSWHDATAYCQWLSDMTGKDYRLPSESQWEYACRAGTTTAWSTGKRLTHDQANFNEKNNGTVPVNSYQPNDFGLYQMHGNVWEWCQDKWVKSYKDAPADGSARESGGSARVLRGGSWVRDGNLCRSSCRDVNNPVARRGNIGFRVVSLSPIT